MLKGADLKFVKKLGLMLNTRLHRMGKDPDWLARRAGVARATVRELIAGRTNPRISTLVALSEALGYSNCGDFIREMTDRTPGKSPEY